MFKIGTISPVCFIQAMFGNWLRSQIRAAAAEVDTVGDVNPCLAMQAAVIRLCSE